MHNGFRTVRKYSYFCLSDGMYVLICLCTRVIFMPFGPNLIYLGGNIVSNNIFVTSFEYLMPALVKS
jgi:hypothetical protein